MSCGPGDPEFQQLSRDFPWPFRADAGITSYGRPQQTACTSFHLLDTGVAYCLLHAGVRLRYVQESSYV